LEALRRRRARTTRRPKPHIDKEPINRELALFGRGRSPGSLRGAIKGGWR
jgi:hypothetical protein